jgi:hypothetical protein
MHAALKARLEAAAKRNGRSLNTECIARLEDSLSAPDGALIAAEPQPEYRVITDSERAMLDLFRRWQPEKQLSFLGGFK